MELYGLKHMEKPFINMVDNDDDFYRKYLIKIFKNKNDIVDTDEFLIPDSLLKVDEKKIINKTGNKIIKSKFVISKNVVVKISKNKQMLETDYLNSIKLTELNCPNFAQYIGFFSCKDDIEHYNVNKKLPKKFCSKNGKDNYFLFLTYFPLGSIVDFKPENKLEIGSIINQVFASLILAFEKLNFLHNDLHPANVLIKKTNKKEIIYKFTDGDKHIDTYGYEIVLFDFDRGTFSKNNGFHDLLMQLSVFLGTYEILLTKKKYFVNERPFKDLINEFMKITNINILKKFIGNS